MKNSIKSSKILMEKNFCCIKGTLSQRKAKKEILKIKKQLNRTQREGRK